MSVGSIELQVSWSSRHSYWQYCHSVDDA